MTEETVLPKREQVKALLNGTMTREEIATQLGMSTASVSSQLTYLRWMGNFVIYDDDKKLSLATESEYNDWTAAKAAKAGTKKASAGSTKTPAEQYAALTKQIGTEKKQITTWEAKQAQLIKDLANDPNDAEFIEMKAEADAMLVLLNIKLNRNERKLAAMPEPEEDVTDEGDGADEITEAGDDII